jgi:hypothetical protein
MHSRCFFVCVDSIGSNEFDFSSVCQNVVRVQGADMKQIDRLLSYLGYSRLDYYHTQFEGCVLKILEYLLIDGIEPLGFISYYRRKTMCCSERSRRLVRAITAVIKDGHHRFLGHLPDFFSSINEFGPYVFHWAQVALEKKNIAAIEALSCYIVDIPPPPDSRQGDQIFFSVDDSSLRALVASCLLFEQTLSDDELGLVFWKRIVESAIDHRWISWRGLIQLTLEYHSSDGEPAIYVRLLHRLVDEMHRTSTL